MTVHKNLIINHVKTVYYAMGIKKLKNLIYFVIYVINNVNYNNHKIKLSDE